MNAKLATQAMKKNPTAYANACARRNAMVAAGTNTADACAIADTWFRAIIAGIYTIVR